MKQFSTHSIHSSQPILKNKVFWVSILIVLLIALTFWSQSRVPALNDKAQMGDRINISAIAFDIVFPIIESQPLYERTIKAAINWGYTNWKGMTFGFLLAAAFISLIQSLPKTLGSKNKWINSLIGLTIGSPLGVCVNCATPIAQGMIHAGSRLEVALAMLMSSPTLNPIVLTIAFSLLSFHMALIKVLISIFFIIFIIPLIIRLSGNLSINPGGTATIESQATSLTHIQKNNLFSLQPSPNNWFDAIKISILSFLKNLFYIIKITLPFMLLAGLLGSFLIESLPTDSLPNLTMNPLTLFIIAAIGVFLPVPIAFDVLIVNILISSGLTTGLAATLLFSLGIFSIYPALIIARSISIKLSLLLFISTLLVAIIAGTITHYVDNNLRLTAKVSIEKALNKQTPRLSLQEAIDTCEIFKATKRDKQCLNKLLLSDLFTNADIKNCHLDSVTNNDVLKNNPYIGMCQQIFSFSETKKKSVEKNNIDECLTLKNSRLNDECKIHFIRSQSNRYTSLDACSQVKSIGGQRYCRAMVIADRMQSKSIEACNLDLSADMHRQCIDNLNAHITSAFGELEKCNELATDNARNICRSTVVSLKISKLKEFSICSKLTAKKEIDTCNDLVIMQKALQQMTPSLCVNLTNKRMINDCQINAVIQHKRVDIEKQKLLAFKSTLNDNKITKNPSPSETTKKTLTNPLHWTNILNDKNITLSSTPHFNRKIKQSPIFKSLSGEQLGLKSNWDINLTDFMEPFIYGKGIASGDFNNDGWPDLAFASSNGIHLYQNNGHGAFNYFRHVTIKNHSLNTFIVSFVDIDNDGWQDLYLTAYNDGSYFFKNEQGDFTNNALVHLPANNNIVTLAAGFADWNKDGLLDLATGNWSYGAEGAFIPQKSQNIWYTNKQLNFIPLRPNEVLGETLSILMSDINHDGNIDMLIGNDRKYPDMFYLGNSTGEFTQITDDMKIIPQTSFNTMSYDSADFNNDLLLDIFSTDMSMTKGDSRDYCDALTIPTDKKRCQWLLQGVKAVKLMDVGWCEALESSQRAECYTAMAIKLAKRDKNKQLCRKISTAFPAKADFCNNISNKLSDIKLPLFSNNLQQKESNKLLINTENQYFIDKSNGMGIKNSFWGWNGKAADLDNDGWQDIYIGNGLGFGQHDKNIHSNVFYHNQQGLKFIQNEEKFGLTNYINTPSYTYIDFDLDGDIDIISSGIMSTPSVFLNQGTTGNSISFVLRDQSGNKFCIGCKVIIHYSNGSKSQIREMKLSGGFMSYDDPVLYFGLADYTHIDSLKVIWSDGEEWSLKHQLNANHRYKINRQKNKVLNNDAE